MPLKSRNNIIETFGKSNYPVLDNPDEKNDGNKIIFRDNLKFNRVPNDCRVDDSLTFHVSSNKRIIIGDWVISIGNLYGCRSVFSVIFDDTGEEPVQDCKLLLLGDLSPFLWF